MRATATVLGLAAVALLVALPLAAFVLYGLAGGGVGAPPPLPGAAVVASRLGLTLLVGAAVGAGALALGIPVALLLERTGRWRGRRLARALVLAPLVVPPYLHAIAWLGLVAGPAAAGADALAPGPSAVAPMAGAGASWIFSPLGTILVLVAALWPCAAWAAAAGLRAVDPGAEEAALLAAGRGAALRRVTLPLAARHAAAGALLAAVLAMAETGVPAIFGTPTLAAEVYARFAAFYDAGGALVLALVQAAPAALAAAAAARLLPAGPALAGAAGPRPAGAPTLVAGAGLAALLVPAAAGLGAGLLLPLGSLAASLGPAPFGALAGAWSSGAGDLARTLALAGAGAAVATGLALALRLALGLDRGLRPARLAAGAAAFSGFALPGAAVGIGLIAAYNRPGLPGLVYGSAAVVVLAYVARALWIPWTGLGAGLRALGPGPSEAARLAGLPWWRTALGVQAPALRAETAAFFALAFLFCYGELGSVLLVHPPGVDVLPWRLFDLVHYSYDSTVAALGLMSVAASVAMISALLGVLGGESLMRRSLP
jgi:iron(III) transport system permease protein